MEPYALSTINAYRAQLVEQRDKWVTQIDRGSSPQGPVRDLADVLALIAAIDYVTGGL